MNPLEPTSTSVSGRAQSADAVPLEVRYDLTADDFRVLLKYMRARNPDGSRKVPVTRGVRALLLLIVAMAGSFWYLSRLQVVRNAPVPPQVSEWRISQFMPLITVSCIIVLSSAYFISRRNALKAAADDPRMRNRRFVLLPGGYTVGSDLEVLETRWQAVLWIAVTRAHLFFVTAARENFIEAQIVPRRAFSDDAHFNRMLQAVQRFYPGDIQDER